MHTQPYQTRGIPLIPGMRRHATVETTCTTVLFAELRGYDALVEKMPPVQVVSLLEEFFAVLTCAVLEYSGQIIHLSEADMMAGFGVGDTRRTQIHEAVAAARAIQRRFAPIRASWQTRHAIDAAVGIGIHRGDVAVGLLGAAEHRALTLVGDAVHTAAQLCRRARAGEVLLSAAVYSPSAGVSATTAPTEPLPLLHLPELRLCGRSTTLDTWCIPLASRLQMRHAARH